MADAGEKKNNFKGIIFIIFSALALVGGGAYLWHMSAVGGHMPALSIQRYGDGGYMFKIDDKPFLVKGFCYNPIPVGKDFEYDFWADPGKPWLTDGKLMKEAGVNAVRIYRTGKHPNLTKQGIHDLYSKFGIRTFVGHYLGFWDWPPANYANGAYQTKMTEDVLTMVRTYKDEPGIIGWILGNENNYSFDRNLRNFSTDEIDKLGDPEKMWEARARIYYRFVNNVAKEIRKIDVSRPIVMGIGEIKSLHFAAQETPDIDVLGVIAYRGATFGNLFRQVQQTYDKPVLMIEFGADRFNAYTREEDQASQSRFVELQWKDIERNSVIKTGSGNAIGGLVFEWSDEWWKGNEALAHTWSIHDQAAQWSHSAYYYDYEAPGRMNINEEWWGVVSLTPRSEKAQNGIDQRTTTRTYDMLKSLWTKDTTSVVADTGTKAPSITLPGQIESAGSTPTPGAGHGLVLQKTPDGGYSLSLNGNPFVVQGASYGGPGSGAGPGGYGGSDAGGPSGPAGAGAGSGGSGFGADAGVAPGTPGGPVGSSSGGPSGPSGPSGPGGSGPGGPGNGTGPGLENGGPGGTGLGADNNLLLSASGGLSSGLGNGLGTPVLIPAGFGDANILTDTRFSGAALDGNGARFLNNTSTGLNAALSAMGVGSLADVTPSVVTKLTQPGQPGSGLASSFVMPSFWDRSDAPWRADAAAMRPYGINTVGLSVDPSNIAATVKATDDFYQQKIYSLLSYDLGYSAGSPLDYSDPATQDAVLKVALDMVRQAKGREQVLAWVIGYKNHLPYEAVGSPANQAAAAAYFSFANQVADEIKKLDPSRIVILQVVDRTRYAEELKRLTPRVDVIAVIREQAERAAPLIEFYRDKVGKPVIVMFGADSYNAASGKPDEAAQAKFLTDAWKDVQANTTFVNPRGTALGGAVYEWADQWWRADGTTAAGWLTQTPSAQGSSPVYTYDFAAPANFNVNEEWFGLNRFEVDGSGKWVMVPKAALRSLSDLWLANFTQMKLATPPARPAILTIAPLEAAPVIMGHTPLIKIVRNAAGGANLAAGGEAVWVRGVVYEPTPIGQGPAYDYLADTTSPWKNDGKLMAEAGINSVITHVSPNNIPGALSVADDLLKNHKIWTFAALDPGLWTAGSVPNYADPATRERIADNVLASVRGLEGSNGIAAWVISNRQGFLRGNERLSQSAWESYYSFLNELTQKIKAEDPSRPVVVEVAGTDKFKWASGLLTDADAIGVYGKDGAWSWKKTFDQIRKDVNKPVLVLAYGADSYDASAAKPDEDAQAWMIESQWRALDPQTTRLNDAGQALGGFVHEWSDAWWAADPAAPSTWTVQDATAQSSSAAYPADYTAGQMNVNEEWFGIMKLRPAAPGTAAPVLAPKKVYETLRQMWTGPSDVCMGKG